MRGLTRCRGARNNNERDRIHHRLPSFAQRNRTGGSMRGLAGVTAARRLPPVSRQSFHAAPATLSASRVCEPAAGVASRLHQTSLGLEPAGTVGSIVTVVNFVTRTHLRMLSMGVAASSSTPRLGTLGACALAARPPSGCSWPFAQAVTERRCSSRCACCGVLAAAESRWSMPHECLVVVSEPVRAMPTSAG